MVTPIDNIKMDKYNFIKAHSDYELKCVIGYIERKQYKLITVTTFNNVMYVFYDQETT